jgi:hypothetical protein
MRCRAYGIELGEVKAVDTSVVRTEPVVDADVCYADVPEPLFGWIDRRRWRIRQPFASIVVDIRRSVASYSTRMIPGMSPRDGYQISKSALERRTIACCRDVVQSPSSSFAPKRVHLWVSAEDRSGPPASVANGAELAHGRYCPQDDAALPRRLSCPFPRYRL